MIRRFVEAVLVEWSELPAARAACIDALGEKGTAQIAAVIANYDGVNRIADGTGIRVEHEVLEAGGREIIDTLGLDGQVN